MALKTTVQSNITVVDEATGLKEFEYSGNIVDLTLNETNSQRFKINDGVNGLALLTTELDKANFLFLVSDSDDLQLYLVGGGSFVITGDGIKLKAGRPFILFTNEVIDSITISNNTGAAITGKFYAGAVD